MTNTTPCNEFLYTVWVNTVNTNRVMLKKDWAMSVCNYLLLTRGFHHEGCQKLVRCSCYGNLPEGLNDHLQKYKFRNHKFTFKVSETFGKHNFLKLHIWGDFSHNHVKELNVGLFEFEDKYLSLKDFKLVMDVALDLIKPILEDRFLIMCRRVIGHCIRRLIKYMKTLSESFNNSVKDCSNNIRILSKKKCVRKSKENQF